MCHGKCLNVFVDIDNPNPTLENILSVHCYDNYSEDTDFSYTKYIHQIHFSDCRKF